MRSVPPVVLLASLLAFWISPSFAGLIPEALRCEDRENPIGIDAVQPRLSWNLEADNPDPRGQSQTAWQLLVATSPEILATNKVDLWASGRVPSPQRHLIAYNVKPLRSCQVLLLKVRVWDKGGEPSFWKSQLSLAGLTATTIHDEDVRTLEIATRILGNENETLEIDALSEVIR